jgi:hypothetical protein
LLTVSLMKATEVVSTALAEQFSAAKSVETASAAVMVLPEVVCTQLIRAFRIADLMEMSVEGGRQPEAGRTSPGLAMLSGDVRLFATRLRGLAAPTVQAC